MSERSERTMSTARCDTTSRRGLVIGLALGLPVFAVGVRGALLDAADAHPAELGRWLVGSALVHDLAVLPLVGAAGWGLRRIAPPAAWPAVRAGATIAAVLALVSWPFVAGYGRSPGNPSLLPRDYVGGTAAAVGVVAAATVIVAAALVTRVRRRPRPPRPGPSSSRTPRP
jgi:hypothetical protein